MKVTLIDYTGCGAPFPAIHAMNILIFTKSTRLNMSPGLMNEIDSWSHERKLNELEYMATTIPSSWEFVDYTFLIEDVTRAFTHQLVRTRQGSYAQQTMRILDMSSGPGWDYLIGPSISENQKALEIYQDHMSLTADAYRDCVEAGAKIEDARGLLPTNILTNIVAKFNMRTLTEMSRKRASSRTQDEYRSVLDEVRRKMIEVHPWVEIFLSRSFDRAAADLEAMLREKLPAGDDLTKMIKLIDQMRNM